MIKNCILLLCCLVAYSAAFKISVEKPDYTVLECAVCQYLVSEIQDGIEENVSSATILANLNQDCSTLYNPTWITACQQLVAEYGTQLVPYVGTHNPYEACSSFQLCPSDKKSTIKQEPVKGEIECGVCTFVASKVELYIEENKTETEIATQLDKDCRILRDKSWISVCDGLINEFTPEIISLAEQKYPADVICQDIKFCNTSSSSPAVIVKKPSAPTGEIECEVCDWLVTLGEHYAELNYTEDEIVHTMADSCDILIDSSFVSACKQLVEEDGDDIVQYILNKENPSTICSQIDVCPNSTCADSPSSPSVGDVECSVCEWLATVGEKYVAENKTEDEIISALDDSCDVLIDKTWISDCKTLVSENGAVIVQYLLNKESPEVICTDIKACSSSSVRVEIKVEASDVECSVCHWLTTLAEKYIEDNKTESEIVNDLAKSCDILIDKSWISACNNIVEMNGDLIVQYLLNKEDPQVICQQIGACSNSSSYIVAKPVVPEQSVECSVCEWLATLGEHYVEENKTETEILDSLSIACDVLIDKTWVSECHDLVEEDGDVLVEYLLNKESPEVVCEQIDACPSNTTSSSVPPSTSPLPILTPIMSTLLGR